jgi:hypothetical protein
VLPLDIAILGNAALLAFSTNHIFYEMVLIWMLKTAVIEVCQENDHEIKNQMQLPNWIKVKQTAV